MKTTYGFRSEALSILSDYNTTVDRDDTTTLRQTVPDSIHCSPNLGPRPVNDTVVSRSSEYSGITVE